MKILAIAALLAAIPLAAAGIDGKWVSEMQVGDADGKTYLHTTTFNLKSDGSTVTGTCVQTSEAPWMRQMTGKTVEITGGKIDGDKFSFRITLDTDKGQRTSIYEGTISGDELKGSIKYRGIGMTRPFLAKRGA
jgi:hypothetical protein